MPPGPREFTATQDAGVRRPALVVFLWLAFSAFPIIDLISSQPPLWRAAILLALAAAFIGTYLYAMMSDRRLPGTQGWYVVAPLAIYITVQGLRNALPQHVRLARWTLPIWLYVSVTGVVVYWMLYVMEL